MKPEIATQLGDANDFYTLTKAVLSLCEPYGPVHAFRMVHNRGSARVACLIELESPKQQQALARSLGGRVLNGAACLEIPVDRDFGGTRKVAVLHPQPAVQVPRQASFKATVATS